MTTNSGHGARPLWSGAWAKPLRARKFHFFRDRASNCLCRAYMTIQVLPSEYGTGQPDDERCPTCERKLGYFVEASRVE
jgi:hypothetical protein